MRRFVPLTVLLLLASMAPSASAQTDAGVYRHSVTHGGETRAVVVVVPERKRGGMPLLVLLHTEGDTGHAFGRARQALVTQATRRGWAVAVPDGSPCRGGSGLCWASRDDPSGVATSRADDVGLLRELVAGLDRMLDLDTRRVYWAGHSEGGGMVHRMATEAPDLVAAGAIVSGLIGRTTDPGGSSWSMLDLPTAPVSMLIVHGIEDRMFPYNGYQRGSAGFTTLPAVYAANTWGFDANGCDRSGVVKRGFTGIGNRLNGSTGTMDFRAGCRNGSAVRFVAVGGHGHGWPSARDGYDADREVAVFFQGRSR